MTITTNTGTVSVALESFAELPDWLAALMRPNRLADSLRRHVPEIADGRLEIVSCRADQLRAKDDQWHVRCRLSVARSEPSGSEPSGSGSEPSAQTREVVLVGLLHPPGRPDPDPIPSSALPFGTDGYEVWLPDLRVHLATEEADPGLPALGDLTDPDAAARLIEGMLRQGAHPSARVRSATPNVARYKPGSRCTIVYDIDYEPGAEGLPNPVIAKTHQGDKGAFAHQAMSALWGTSLSEGRSVLIAEPLGYLPQERILLQGPVPEDRTLKDLCVEAFETGDADLLEVLRGRLTETAHALAALHTSGAVYPRSVTVADWMAETREVVARLGHTVPELPGWAAPLIATLDDLDATTRPDPLVSSHHDFRPAQVLLNQEGLAFIDFDGAAMAEAGLDIGRFRGKLRDIGVTALAAQPDGYREDRLRDRLELLDAICDDFLADYRRHAPVSPGRVELWELIDLFMALLHSWTKVRLLRVHPRLAIVQHRLRSLAVAPPE